MLKTLSKIRFVVESFFVESKFPQFGNGSQFDANITKTELSKGRK